MGSGDCWNLPSPSQFPALPEAAHGGHKQPDQARRQLLIGLNSAAANYRPQGFTCFSPAGEAKAPGLQPQVAAGLRDSSGAVSELLLPRLSLPSTGAGSGEAAGKELPGRVTHPHEAALLCASLMALLHPLACL